MIGFFNTDNTFSLVAIQALKTKADTLYILDFDENITTLVHPGVYHTTTELDAVSLTVNNSTYDKVKNSSIASHTINPPSAFWSCTDDPDICQSVVFDMRAAEYWALRACAEDNYTYANTAVSILDAWADGYPGHSTAWGQTRLMVSWGLLHMARAVEVLVHYGISFFAYPSAELTRVEALLDDFYRATPTDGHVGNNWASSWLASSQGYWVVKHGLATNDTDRDFAVSEYKRFAQFNDMLAMIYIYMNSDGSKPYTVDFNTLSWNGYTFTTNFGIAPYGLDSLLVYQQVGLWSLANDTSCFTEDGLVGEYWRDMAHAGLGLNFINYLFETAYIQGYKDYYELHGSRIQAGLEAFFAAANKARIGGSSGYYLQAANITSTNPLTAPIISGEYRDESRKCAAFLKRGREKGWNIDQQEENFSTLGFVDDMGSSKSCYEYTFKGIDKPDNGTLIFDIDFSVNSIGAYTEALQEADFQNYNGESLHYLNHDGSSMIGDSSTTWENRVSIVDDGTENVLDVLYTANEFGFGTASGFLQCCALPLVGRPTEDINNPTEITLEYSLKFVNGFDWGYGGKLPGLAGGLIPSGGVSTPYYDLYNGFSGRFMWEDLWGVSGTPSSMKPYLYSVLLIGGSDPLYGDGAYFNPITVPTDIGGGTDSDTDSFQQVDATWYKITQKIRPNTPNNSDGTMKLYLDDILMGDFVGLKFIADGYHGDYTVDRLCFSTFYGGGSAAWAPSVDTHIRFKDFKIYEKA